MTRIGSIVNRSPGGYSPSRDTNMPRKNGSNGNGKTPENKDPARTTLPAREESIALLMERFPEIYARCVKFIEEGHSPGGVAALCGVPIATVRKIRNLIGESAIHAGIRAVGRNLVEASQQMSERLVNEAGAIPIHLLPSALGVIVDRAQLLHGSPTARVEHRSVPSPEDLQKMFDALPTAKAIDVAPAEHKIVQWPDPIAPTPGFSEQKP